MSGTKQLLLMLFVTLSTIATTGQAALEPKPSVQGGVSWVPHGPSPLQFGGSENVGTNNPSSGAVHAVAPHPSDADILFIASVNGGIWRTGNATAASPTWTRQTDTQYTLSTSDVSFDPTDGSNQTLVGGFGRFSSFASRGGARGGVIRTTNGGTTWTELSSSMRGRNIANVVVRGTTILAAVNIADVFSCSNLGVFRSTNTGASFSRVTSGLAGGAVAALVGDPATSSTFYASVYTFNGGCDGNAGADGIYKSTDSGANWSKVSSAAMDALIPNANNTGTHFEIAVGNANNVYVAIVPSTTGQLGGVFRSGNGGVSWVQMDTPGTNETGFVGIHPGGQGGLHMSLVADPVNPNIVYIGGDRQPRTLQDAGGFPNSIGAQAFSGRLFRGDAALGTGLQWSPLTHNGTASNSSPHADSRDMAFDANGNIVQGDDGGVFRRTSPGNASGDWIDVNGNLQITEQHSMAHDRNSNIIISGNQDNGSTRQNNFASNTWSSFLGGDGSDVVIDLLTLAGSNLSVRFASAQNLQAARRLVYNASNGFLGSTNLSLTVVSGAALVPQFTTPLATNQVSGSRLIIGADNSVYESLDQGDTVSEISPTGLRTLASGANTIAYGAVGNTNILYVAGCQGSCFAGDNDGLFLRTSAAGALSLVYPPSNPTARTVNGVTLDASDSAQAFAIESDGVFRTTNTGGTWSNVTGNLGSFTSGAFRSIQFVPAADDALLLGTNSGVFISRSSSGFSIWTELGTGLPNAPVFDLRYDPGTDRVFAGTLGRGAFSVTPALGGNRPPEPVDDALRVATGGTATVLLGGATSLLGNDIDPDADNLVANTTPISAPTNGSVTIALDGSFSYTHNGTVTFLDSFQYQVCDDGVPVLCANANVSVVIGGAECSSPGLDLAVGIGSFQDTMLVSNTGLLSDLNLSLDISHAWPGDLQISLTHVGTGTTVQVLNSPQAGNCQIDDVEVVLDDEAATPADTQCEATPPAIRGILQPTGSLAGFDSGDLSGSWRLDISDTFPNADGGTLNAWCLHPTIALPNTNPVANDDSGANVSEAGMVMIDEATIKANDTDAEDGTPPGGSISLTGLQTNGSAALNAGTVTFTHDGSETGNGSFQYQVMDSAGASSNVATVTISVTNANDNPVANADSGFNVAEGGPVMISEASLKANDTDEEDGIPPAGSIILMGVQTNGSASLMGTTVTFIHDGSETSSGSFQYQVMDSAGAASNSATVSISVTNANDNPVANADSGFNVVEGGMVMINQTSLMANDTDEEDGTPPGGSVSLSGVPSNGSASLVDGTVTFTHDGSETGSGSFQYRVTDSNGAISNVATVTIAVNNINDAPVAAADSGFNVVEGEMVVITESSLKANDTDEEDGTPPGGDISLAGIASNGSASLDAGDVSFRHDGSQTNSGSFQYQVMDSGGLSSNIVTVTLSVSNTNDAPVANDDTGMNVATGGSLMIAGSLLKSNDTDEEDGTPPGGAIVLAGTEVNGTASLDNDIVTFSHDGSATTTASFQYQVMDSTGAISNIATVNMGVSAMNNSPMASNDPVSSPQGSAIIIEVLANDVDVDGSLDATSVSLDSGPVNGATNINAVSGEITYTPVNSFVGDEVFSYTVRDNNGAISNVATVTVSVFLQPFAQCALNGRRIIVDLAANIDVSSVFGLTATGFVASGLPTSLAIDSSTGIISGTPQLADLGASPYPVRVTADDGIGGVENFDFSIVVENDFDSIFFSSYEETCVDP